MDVWIVTGANRGLGEGLGSVVLDHGHGLISLGRSPHPQNHPSYLGHWDLELSDLDQIGGILPKVFHYLKDLEYNKLVLVNNAAILGRLEAMIHLDPKEIQEVLHINLIAPILLSASFARWVHQSGADDAHLLNISSGAGRHSYPGWGPYCISKAGLDMLSLVLADDEKMLSGSLRVYSLAPGVVATGMQKSIREVGDQFPWGKKFQEYHKTGALSDPKELGNDILDAFYQGKIPSGELSDVRRL